MTTLSASSCYHCGSPVPSNAPWHITLDATTYPLCCPGCEAVAHAIVQGGLERYYQQRTELPDTPAGETLDSDAWAYFDSPDFEAKFRKTLPPGVDSDQLSATLAVEGITCNACGWLIEHRLNALKGITSSAVDLSRHRLHVSWQPSKLELSQLLAELAGIGYSALPFEPDPAQERGRYKKRLCAWRLGVSGACLLGITLLMLFLPSEVRGDLNTRTTTLLHWLPMVLATLVMLFATPPFFRQAIVDIKRGLLGPAMPTALALGCAYLASGYASFFHAGEHNVGMYVGMIALLTTLLLLFGCARSLPILRSPQDTFKGALPATTIRRYPDESERILPACELCPGARIVVNAGQRIPADGIIEQGASSLNTSQLTGEPLPVSYAKGDSVLAGCQNLENPLVINVVQPPARARIAALGPLVDAAFTGKHLASINARGVHPWSAGLLIITPGVTALWWWFKPLMALDVLLSLLIAGSPCALALATPAALTVAYQQLRARGVVITNPRALLSLATTTQPADEAIASCSDVVILSPQSGRSVETLAIARATQRCIQHSMGMAASISVIALCLAAVGALSPFGAITGAGVSVLAVIANTLRFSHRLSTSNVSTSHLSTSAVKSVP